ncbi:hypothetical protein IFM47457_08463 [Aspergillus lentulus]|nr:hypothetical protein IFM47457_08463 [Aspergillus lentulus]
MENSKGDGKKDSQQIEREREREREKEYGMVVCGERLGVMVRASQCGRAGEVEEEEEEEEGPELSLAF